MEFWGSKLEPEREPWRMIARPVAVRLPLPAPPCERSPSAWLELIQQEKSLKIFVG
jgi:hypothetical protein